MTDKLDIRLLIDIDNDVTFVKQMRSSYGFKDFQKDVQLRYALLKALENIGEATHRLSPSFKRLYASRVDFDRYRNERNYIVHQYYDTASENYLIFLWNSYIPNEIFKLGNVVHDLLTPIRKNGIKDGSIEL